MKKEYFYKILMIVGVGILLNMVAVHVMTSELMQIITIIVGSGIMITALVQYMRVLLKERKLGITQFE